MPPRGLISYLDDILSDLQGDNDGRLQSAPPEMGEVDPDRLGFALTRVNGSSRSVGDNDYEFTIQSISKTIVYAMALQDRGFETVELRVDVEPSGESYSAISVEEGSGRPENPMINAGAMTVHGLLGGDGADEDQRIEWILDTFSRMAGRQLRIDEDMFEAEMRTTFRNIAIANLLRSTQCITDDPLDVVRGYTKQCSILVTVEDLSMIAATLANNGHQPMTGERIFEPDVVRRTLSVMTTCGMYDASGDWVSRVGIPAKSGVGGGIMGVLPGRVGIASFSPKLDEHGTSVRGYRFFTRISDDLGLHLLRSPDEQDIDD